MIPHIFGGEWTELKLDLVRKYLCAYMTIFKRNERAMHFHTTYIDAFAGTGEREPRLRRGDEHTIFGYVSPKEARLRQKGSARLALEIHPPFDEYILIEQNSRRAAALRQLVADFPKAHDRVRVIEADANTALRSWCTSTDVGVNRAVVFLDPYGMQVEWSTLEALSRWPGIDLWYLFPLMGLNRVLTRNVPPPRDWEPRITRCLGTDSWEAVFYQTTHEPGLFQQIETTSRTVGIDGIAKFIVDRLKTIFPAVVPKPFVLCNSKGSPLYLLCFAASNPKACNLARRIAGDILTAARKKYGDQFAN